MATADNDVIPHDPYVPPSESPKEFTLPAVLVGAVLGIIFGASSLYLLLKVGMTVSASVPIAVLSITLFRAFSRWFGFRRATILENNIVQTTGSAGESLAFGVGVTMPALLLIGFEMDPIRVMTVSLIGGALGILMMIPLRRAFIVKQHGKLKYPEGTACAEVLVAGERGGASARMVFIGFGIAFAHKFLNAAMKLWPSEPAKHLYTVQNGKVTGLRGAEITGDLSPELLGVGFLIGPRIANMMMAGAVISFFIIGPLIATFGANLETYVPPAKQRIEDGVDVGLIKNMEPGHIYANYLRYIGAGAVAAGGIISMFRALPLIIGSIVGGLRDLRSTRGGGGTSRTERDMPMTVVLFGSIALVVIVAAIPQMGLGLTAQGLLSALMILIFGFLFVTVSSRLTGEVGSSSNPISGMTIATLLLTCLIFYFLGRTAHSDMLTALSIAAVVCIASSNGGTTSQDLKTGFLVGATPKAQQYGLVVGAATSAIVIGGTMLALNAIGTHYTKKGVPDVTVSVPADAPRQQVGQPYNRGDLLDTKEYRVVHILKDQVPIPGTNQFVAEGRYLVDDSGRLVYKTDLPIRRESDKMDNGSEAPQRFKAPQPQLFELIIKGILGGSLEWALVIAGALMAISMELMGVSALPVAVGMYLGLTNAVPIFVGGLVRWAADKARGGSGSEAETETSPGVLLSSGYIAGGTLCGLIVAFFAMMPETFNNALNLGQYFGKGDSVADRTGEFLGSNFAMLLAVGIFAALALFLYWIGRSRSSEVESEIVA